VESWYPRSDDTYGLLLEDDVELSPLFYAWIKLVLLSYRYGVHAHLSLNMFGISLYQQKNLELHPSGRRAFSARDLFSSLSVSPNSPYLSQIPCSWGAVYFPQHWREFHDYLAVRLSEEAISIDQDVVPYSRSNKWSKSWKKFFIEMVYLRGYTMLYPNYEDFISLSTNHLEVGSHVKDKPAHVYLKKRELFRLPLMMLPNDTSPVSPLLDLPGGQLPPWADLPVLDLFGEVTSQHALNEQGIMRREELTNCSGPAMGRHDVRELACIAP
jgi:hypothetical protein